MTLSIFRKRKVAKIRPPYVKSVGSRGYRLNLDQQPSFLPDTLMMQQATTRFQTYRWLALGQISSEKVLHPLSLDFFPRLFQQLR